MTANEISTRAEFAAASIREFRGLGIAPFSRSTDSGLIVAQAMGGEVSGLSIRSVDDDGVLVEGYAAITHVPYAVRDFLGEYMETFERGSFAKTVRDADDTRWLANHTGIALARTKSSTLKLGEITNPDDDPQGRGQTGLWTSANFDPKSPNAQTLISAMERGDLDQMSHSFQAIRQTWNADYSDRVVLEARTYDVSGVTFPMNPATSVGLVGRSVLPDDFCIEDDCHERATVEVDLTPTIAGTYCAAHAQAVRDAELNRRRLVMARARVA